MIVNVSVFLTFFFYVCLSVVGGGLPNKDPVQEPRVGASERVPVHVGVLPGNGEVMGMVRV